MDYGYGDLEQKKKKLSLIELRLLLTNNKFYMPFISIFSALIVILSVFLMINYGVNKSVSAKNNAAYKQYNELNAQMQSENLKAYEKTLRASFSKPQLIRIAQNETLYSITVNGTNVVTNSPIIYSQTPTVTILLSENYGKNSLNQLPRSIIEMGSIMNIKDAFKLLTISPKNEKINTKLYDFYYGKTISYTIENIKVGEIITIEIEPDLAEKLGFESDYIEVFYNKAAE